MQRDLKKLIAQMTLEEKAGLCSGLDNWHTKPVERLQIPSVMMTDGPHGIRKETEEAEGFLHESVPATCFPSGAALASSWDPQLLGEVGRAIGEEAAANGISIVLGPAVNIKRFPLCGRNFEYYSEDPCLSARMAAGFIRGVQSNGGTGACVKHFAANNKERARMTTDTIVDERTLREIYLASFEEAVREAGPWTVMCAYNRLNGTFCAENRWLLTDVLRGDWGFEGFVMSDWGAVNDRPEGLAAGLELEMPANRGIGDEKIVKAVRECRLSEELLDQTVERILKIVFRAADEKPAEPRADLKAHHSLAEKAAGECMVLLKNDGVLPLTKNAAVAVIGAFAKKVRYQGGGSSHVNPSKTLIPLEEIKKHAGPGARVTYSEGYRLGEDAGLFGGGFDETSDRPDEKLIGEACAAAAAAEVAVIFAGLPDTYESEGYDREHMRMPESHLRLIEAVSRVQKQLVVVLLNGSPVEMPFAGRVPGILEAYLGGQAAGGAIARILFGEVNPSGKLAETFPAKLTDTPTILTLPGSTKKTEYREGVFVGYRYYEKKEIRPLFPFGYGLSYTRFSYTGISLDRDVYDGSGEVNAAVTVKNTGARAGREIVEVYVGNPQGGDVIRPVKELRGFQKVYLNPGEEKTVDIPLNSRAFSCYSEELRDWVVEPGIYEVAAGGSSADTPLRVRIEVSAAPRHATHFTRNTTIRELLAIPEGKKFLEEFAGEELTGDLPEFVMDVPVRSLMHYTDNPEVNEESIDRFLETLNHPNAVAAKE